MSLDKEIKGFGKKALLMGVLTALTFGSGNIYGERKHNRDRDWRRGERILDWIIKESPREQEEKDKFLRKQEKRLHLPQNQRHFFACNYAEDIDGNGVYDFPKDYVRIKTLFNADEPLMLIDYDPFAQSGDSWQLEILAPNGNTIYSAGTIKGNGCVMGTGKNKTNFLTQQLVISGGYGNYRAVWSINGAYIGETNFTIR